MENTYENFKKYIEITTFDCGNFYCCNQCPYKDSFINGACFGAFDNVKVFLSDTGLLVEYIARYAKESYDKGFNDGFDQAESLV